VVILLKSLCFAIWMLIMLSLIIGSRGKHRAKFREVTLYVEDEDDVEMVIRKALSSLKAEDILIIKDVTSGRSPEKRQIISRMLRKNPAILYCVLSENGGFCQ